MIIMRFKTIISSVFVIAALISCSNKKATPVKEAGKLLLDKGIEVPFHPSVDCAELLRQYKANPDLWDAAFEFIAKKAPVIHDLGETDFGTFELVGKRCYVTVAELSPKPFPETKLEGHKKYLDIQLTEGPVRWGVCSSKSEKIRVLEEYDPGRDIWFCLSDDTVYYDQAADSPSIFVFFPKNLHNPSFAAEGVSYETPLKKIVVKVEYAE